MSTIPRCRIRIAADLFKFDNFSDALRGDESSFIPKLRAGDDAQFEIALFNDGVLLTDLSGIESIRLEIKPMHDEASDSFDPDDYEDYDLRGPAVGVVPIREKTLPAAELNATLTQSDWDALEPEDAHAVITLDATETNLAPGDRWVSIVITTSDQPSQIRTIAAGRLRILGGGASQGAPASAPGLQYYSATQSDARFARQSENLGDLTNAADARENLGLGGAALLDVVDEDDFASQSDQHLPTQQSVKAYVDAALAAADKHSARPGVYLDGASGSIDLGNVFNQDMSADWSVSGWFRTTAADEQTLVCKGAAAPRLLVSLTSLGKLRATLDDGVNSVSVESATAMNDGQWRHFAVTVDIDQAAGLALYVDGEAHATSDPTAVGDLSNADSLYLGSTGASGFFQGALSDFAFFSRALDGSDIARLHAHGLADWMATAGNDLEIGLPLDEGIGYQAHDLSEHTRDGLLSTGGFAHLQPKQSGYIRSLGVDAYNGGSGYVELLSDSRDILPHRVVCTNALVANRGASNVSHLQIRRSKRTASDNLLNISDTLVGEPTYYMKNMVFSDTEQVIDRHNVILTSTDSGATKIDIRVHYSSL